MGLAFEILQLIVQIVWCYIESAYRFIIPVPRKKINGEIVLITPDRKVWSARGTRSPRRNFRSFFRPRIYEICLAIRA